MTTRAATLETCASQGRRCLASAILCGILLGAAGHAQAQGFGSPDECQAYRGEDHVNCLYAYIGLQQKRLAQIEEAIHRQTGVMDQMQQQAVVPQEIRQTDTDPLAAPAYTYPPVAPGYAYAGYGYPGVPYGYPAYGAGRGLSVYPGLGLSLAFGGPGLYSRPFYTPWYIYRPHGFYGPRFSYGNRFYSGSRFHPGPRLYSGPRSFGHRSFGHRRR